MEEAILFQKILLSIAIGALIGLERERRAKGETFAGIRTFILVTLLGVLVGYTSQVVNNFIPIYLSLFSIGLLAVASYIAKYRFKKYIGLTTEVALILSFVIGLLFFFESYPYYLPITLGILLTLILLIKEPLHGFAKHLKESEIRSAVIFAILAFVILPLLPNNPVDPFGALNPYTIWLSIVLILLISFVSYAAMKIFGAKIGLALTGVFGGFVSSTAVAISMSERVKHNKKILYSAVFAIVIASSTMFLRQFFVTSIFNPNLMIAASVPLLVLGMSGYALSYLIWKKISNLKTGIDIGSPLAFKPALQFTLFFILILLVSSLAQRYVGIMGLLLVAIVGGLVDVDAITISLATLSLTSLSPLVAIVGIVLAGLSNTLSKWFIVHWLGTKQMSKEIGKIFTTLVIIGILLLIVVTQTKIF